MKTETNQRSLREFAERLTALMPCFMRAVIHEEKNYLAQGLITLPQVWALVHLCENGPCVMQEVTQAVGLRSSTVTSLVDRLVKLGLVKRWNSEKDRRQVLVAITPKGERILNHMKDEKIKTTMAVFGKIAPRERALYLSIMEKVVEYLSPGSWCGKNPKRSKSGKLAATALILLGLMSGPLRAVAEPGG
ncbi:MAG: MarR family transcriptional regulator, partial [Lentisphaerota bacterium]